MNWKQLKHFCNSLPECELEKKVIIWQETEVITEISAEQLEEDYVVNIEEEENGCFPTTEAEAQIKAQPEEYPEGLKHFKKVYDKGTPIIHELF